LRYKSAQYWTHPEQESRATARRTARCRCKFRYVSNYGI